MSGRATAPALAFYLFEMKKIITLSSFLCATLVAFASCNGDKGDDPVQESGKPALEVYWNDSYSGKLGIQVGPLASNPKEPRMFLGGELLYVTGMNCYNLFVQTFERDNMNVDEMEKTVNELAEEKVPIVRFSCIPFYASQMHYYTENKDKYFSNLKHLADLCDQKHILLMPSVFWNISSLPEYFGEPLEAWGDTNSETYKFMRSYTAEVVNALKGHKCLAAWELGNEFNLAADIGSQGYPVISASSIGVAAKGFAETVKSSDTEGRLVCSGHSVMRNAQWHLANRGNWDTDSFAEYKEITQVMTPDPMGGVSEHVYEDARVFSDLGSLNLTYQLARAKEMAASLGKVYYIGEFTGPKTARGDSSMVKKHYAAQYAQKVQLSLLWNYALRGDIEWSFKADSDEGRMAFKFMRRYNDMYAKMETE